MSLSKVAKENLGLRHGVMHTCKGCQPRIEFYELRADAEEAAKASDGEHAILFRVEGEWI